MFHPATETVPLICIFPEISDNDAKQKAELLNSFKEKINRGQFKFEFTKASEGSLILFVNVKKLTLEDQSEFENEIRRFIERIFKLDEFKILETMCMIITSPEDIDEICADESSWVSEDDEDCLEETESDTGSLVLNFNMRSDALDTEANFQENIQQFINTIVKTSNGKQLTQNNEVTAIIAPGTLKSESTHQPTENEGLDRFCGSTQQPIENEGLDEFYGNTQQPIENEGLDEICESIQQPIENEGLNELCESTLQSIENEGLEELCESTQQPIENKGLDELCGSNDNMHQTQDDISMEPSDDDDSSDGSEDDGPVYSSMKQPPLINQLKKILDEYPDDGQILKEIIQNAEDAEASEMKVMFDGRSVNDVDSIGGKPFTKYFKGPALCVYNNAQFTEEDWEGIQMINSSVKEFDPVKIGRFGLGFKSVFHITDYPMIISKNKMLILDPHQTKSERVCILMKLKNLKKHTKEMSTSDCLSALEGIFGFKKDTLQSGRFKGTFFRFPLRSKPTLLSDNVYDESKDL
ncbi:SACS [Mytilus edulis]|uniref:SACS n=1 Tax=Mytilus edulis TaxID=6550 RepID=A0A8S3VDT6_MYTED|nr:SACS [Mytilus edulis]